MTNSLDLLEPNLLLEAIESYDYYTSVQRLILQIIVQTSIAGKSKITTAFLAEKANVSRTAVYKTLKKCIDEWGKYRTLRGGKQHSQNDYENDDGR